MGSSNIDFTEFMKKQNKKGEKIFKDMSEEEKREAMKRIKPLIDGMRNATSSVDSLNNSILSNISKLPSAKDFAIPTVNPKLLLDRESFSIRDNEDNLQKRHFENIVVQVGIGLVLACLTIVGFYIITF